MDSDDSPDFDFKYCEIEKVFTRWFGNGNHSDIEIKNAAHAFYELCGIPLEIYNGIWSKPETREALTEFKKNIDGLWLNYSKLPLPVKDEIERIFKLNGERIGPGRIVLKLNDGSYTSEIPLGIILSMLHERINGVTNLSKIRERQVGIPADRYFDAIAEASKKNEPTEEQYEKTEKKLRKVITVEQARYSWEHFKGEEAPVSQNEVPGEFGKFLQEAWACLIHLEDFDAGISAKSLMRTWKIYQDAHNG